MSALNKKSFFGAAIGTMIEYYDYALFSTFLPLLAPLFFPTDSVYHSLVKGYFVLLITMFARPFGAIFFGYFGDAQGRRKALLLSMYGIAFATVVIGLTPEYGVLGVWTTVIVIAAKCLQAFCFGGEYNGAGIYVVEHAQNKKEGFISSLLVATTIFGSLLASFIGVGLTADFMPSWSWRIAFLLGGLIGVFGIFYRKNLAESPVFKKADMRREGFTTLIKLHPKELLAGVFMGGLATAPYTTALTFISPVLMAKGYFTNHQFMLLQTVLNLVVIATLLPVGIIADKTAPDKVMKFACWTLTIFSYPLLMMVDSGNSLCIISALIVLVVINEIFLGPLHAYSKHLFPVQYRYRGCSMGFCLGISTIGGITPLVENYFFEHTGQFGLIAVWLAFIGMGTLVTMKLAEKKLKLVSSNREIARAVNF